MDFRNSLEMVSRSDAGKVRSQNEDVVRVLPELGLALLADGMGGYNAGEVAAAMAVDSLAAGLQQSLEQSLRQPAVQGDSCLADDSAKLRAVLESQVSQANQAIYELAQSQPQYAGMGSTLVAALFQSRQLAVAHLGDSRCYRSRGLELRCLTRDHSLLQEQIDSGLLTEAQARQSPQRNLLTRALGVDPVAEPDIQAFDLLPGDIYLLCSDGLNDMVEEGDIAAILQAPAADLALCAERLIQLANDKGGRDNISVVLVRIVDAPRETRRWLARFLAWFRW